MAYTFSFADNETYSAEDINHITKRLVTEGVADFFTDGTPYNLSHFNEAGTLVYTEGVVPETVNTLKVAVSGKTVTIYPGTAFFSDGATIEIASGGHTLSRTLGAVNYVYLKNDLINSNTCYPAISTEAPSGIYVMLAEIAADGTVTDKRVYARGKLPGYASSAFYPMVIQDTVQIIGGQAESKTYALGNNAYRFLMAVNGGIGDSDESARACLGLYSFADGRYMSFDFVGSSAALREDALTVYRSNVVNSAHAKVTHTATDITLDFTWYQDTKESEFPITLYLL